MVDYFISTVLPRIRVIAYFIVGFVSIYLVSFHAIFISSFLVLYALLTLMILMVTVAFLISECIKQQNKFTDPIRYARKDILYLFGKVFLLVGSSYLMGTLFLSRANVDTLEIVLFVGSNLFVSLYALNSIFKSERLRELNIRNIQAENLLLKAQLNPHFLYNTLNNIDALIYVDQDHASQAVITLSSLMRYMTYQTLAKRVPLQDEVKHLQEYIDLQRLRLSRPEILQWEVALEENPEIAPMILMPFIENCFKHAARLECAGDIRIAVTTSQGVLTLQTSNPMKVGEVNVHTRGIGLETICRRLALLYPQTHDLAVKEEKGLYQLTLRINYRNVKGNEKSN